MGSPEQEDRLLVAMHEGVAYVQVCGRGTFKVSGTLKEFGLAAIENGKKRIVLDMSRCVGMDSTFMGVLAGLAMRLRKKGGEGLALINLSEKTRALLATLGLDQVVQVHMAGTPADIDLPDAVLSGLKGLECEDAGRAATAQTMLEAHENLVTMSPENYPRFKDVLTFLREDLEKATAGEKPPGRPAASPD